MENKNNVAIMSILIALVALMILILSMFYIIQTMPATKAKVENMIDPLNAYGRSDSYFPNIIQVRGSGDDDDDDDDDEDEDPTISGLPDVTLDFGEFVTLDLDSYSSDEQDSHSELDFEYIYTPSVSPSPITISIDNSTHIMTITESNGVWTGIQAVSIRVIDTDDNTDTDSFTVTITDGSGPQPNGPNVAGIPDVVFGEDGSDSSIDLDDYVTDPDNTDAEMTWTYSGNSDVQISINSSNVVTFTSTPNWHGAEFITFRATDPDGHYDEDVMLVTVTPVDDPSVWLSLSDQHIDEDSPDGTLVYPNIVSMVSDVDSPINVNVVSTNTHFDVIRSGNDLIVNNLEADWHGNEVVVLECNGITAMFTLYVDNVQDCIEICSYGVCYEYCD
jgi:hypothetical protein